MNRRKRRKNRTEIIDYSEMPLSPKELLVHLSILEGIAVLFAYLFYEHWIAVFVLSLTIPVFLKAIIRRRKQERVHRLNRSFLDGIEAMAGAMQAGYSAENALHAATENLTALYYESSDIVREFRHMERRMAMGGNLEELLGDLGDRSGAEDIRDFTAVFSIGRRSGGRLAQIMTRTSQMMRDKREAELEIAAMLSARRMEQTIMSIMPAGILLYLKIISPGFLTVLYGSLTGILIMTVCLALYAAAWLIGQKMMEVEV